MSRTRGSYLRSCIQLCVLLILTVPLHAFGAAQQYQYPATCYDCHGTATTDFGTPPDDIRPVDGVFRNITTGGFQGNHRTHLGPTANKTDCSKCHEGSASYDTGHRNRVVEMADNINSSPVTAKGKYSKTAGVQTWFNWTSNQAGLGTCSNVNCHFQALTPTWGNAPFAYPADCSQCHGAPPSGGGSGTAGSHGKHDTYYPGTAQCKKCHSDHATESAKFAHATSAAQRNIVITLHDPTDAASGTYSGTGANFLPSQGGSQTFGNCSNTYCHSIGNINVGAGALPGAYTGSIYANPAWSGTVACNSCHGRSTASNGMPDYTGGAAGSTTANSHAKHVVGSSLGCVECHEKTTKNGTSIRATSPSYHVNKTTGDVFFNLSGNSKNGTYNSGAKTCSTTYCHGIGPSVAWGGSTTCATCHDATKTSLGGRHDRHYNSTTVFWNLTGNDAHAGGVYVYGCKNCHPTNIHATGPAGTNNDANIATTGVSKISAYNPGGSNASDSRGFKYSVGGTCTTSCHTDGQGGAAVTPVSWTTAPATGCGTCHNKAGDAGPSWSAPHSKHINGYSTNPGFTCNACHAVTASSNTTINGASGAAQHPNGAKDVQFNAFVSPNSAASYPNTATGCANTYCHSQGISFTAPTHTAITWSGGVTCASCHTGGTTTGPSYASGPGKANSHAKHVAAGFTCADCHYGTTADGTSITVPAKHVNKQYDVQPKNPITFTYNSGTPGGNCTNISCHGGNAATWGGTVNCQDCHVGASDTDVWPPFTTSTQVALVKSSEWTTTGHGAAGSYASGNPGANFSGAAQCQYCHDSAVSHNAANIFRLQNYSTTDWGRNAPCMVCHGTGSVGFNGRNATKKVTAYHYGAYHGASNNGGQFCWDCHDGHGDGNAYMIHARVAKFSNRSSGAPVTEVTTTFTLSAPPTAVWGDYVKDTSFDGICQVCHAAAGSIKHFRSGLYDPDHNTGTRCTVCHTHGNVKNDAFKPGGNCDLCHGYPPIRRGLGVGTVFAQNNYSSAKYEEYSGGGGAHSIEKHVRAGARASEGWANCTACHNREEADHTMQTPVRPSKITVDVADGHKFDYQRSLGSERYTGKLTDKSGGDNTNVTGSCSNTNCHFKPSKKWSNER